MKKKDTRSSVWMREKRIWRVLLIVTVCLIVFLLLGCDLHYKNPEFGISLDYPVLWRIRYWERSGTIVIYLSQDNKSSIARIVLYGIVCIDNPDWAYDQIANIEEYIQETQTFYEIDSIVVVQNTIVYEYNDKTIYRKTIKIPTLALPSDTNINQWDEQSPLIDQVMEMYSIVKGEYFVLVRFFPGPSEQANEEGREIIDSIQFLCGDGE